MNIPFNYDSYKEISHFLEENGLRLSKRFGQNFLINRGAREKILSILGVRAGEKIWEIGPGIGSMTAMLLESGAEITAFEIDKGFIRVLQDLFGDSKLSIVSGDVVETWKRARDSFGEPDRIMGNLPYNSAGAIILDLIREDVRCRNMVFTVQKEAALRMAASPGSPSYSSFSIICQFSRTIAIHGHLQPGSFFPSPDVTSTIIEFIPDPDRVKPVDRNLFFAFVQCLFSARRKTIKNNLVNWAESRSLSMDYILKKLSEEGLDPASRGETISPEQAVSLFNRITEGNGSEAGGPASGSGENQKFL